MTYEIINQQRFKCLCERCGYNWIADRLPNACAKCKNRGWNSERIRISHKEGKTKNI